MKYCLLYIFCFNFFLSYSQVKEFKIPLTSGEVDSLITMQKLYVYKTILDTIDKEFKNKTQKNKFLVSIDFRFDKYRSHVGFAGKFFQKELNIEDSNCLTQLKYLYRKNISDSLLLYTSIGKLYSIREILINSRFFNPGLERNNNLYIEINAPTEGWDALYLNSLCTYLDNITKSDFYTNKYYSHKSEKIYVPIYLCNNCSNKITGNKEFLRLYIFSFKNVENKIEIKFNGFMSL